MKKETIKKAFPGCYRFYRESKFYARTLFIPKLRRVSLDATHRVTRLGSQHGWAFIERDYLDSSILISVGLGEDASFDIDFMNMYKAKVYVVDPTPRSINHFQEIVSKFGNRKICEYVLGWRQPIESYELLNVSNNNLVLVPKALWITSGIIKLYSPKNPNHNDFSITNLQKTLETIDVPCITLRDLLSEYKISFGSVGILKLDIEGAATEVLTNIIREGFRPKQILVEFEEIFVVSIRNWRKLRMITNFLDDSGYLLVHSDHVANFTYEYQKNNS